MNSDILAALHESWAGMIDMRHDSRRDSAPLFLNELFLNCKLQFEPMADEARVKFWLAPFDDEGMLMFATHELCLEGGGGGMAVVELYVHPAFRRQRRASRCLEMVCRSADLSATNLFVQPARFADAPMSTEALRLWLERFGFVPVGFGEEARAGTLIRPPIVAKGSSLDLSEQAQVPDQREPTARDWTQPFIHYRSQTSKRTESEILHEFERARSLAIRPIHESTMPLHWCYQNVDRRVREQGGTMILGWQLSAHDMSIGGVEMEAHAVWETPGGELVEVTRSRPEWLFVPSENVHKNERTHILTGDQQFVRLAKAVFAAWTPQAIANPIAADVPRTITGGASPSQMPGTTSKQFKKRR